MGIAHTLQHQDNIYTDLDHSFHIFFFTLIRYYETLFIYHVMANKHHKWKLCMLLFSFRDHLLINFFLEDTTLNTDMIGLFNFQSCSCVTSQIMNGIKTKDIHLNIKFKVRCKSRALVKKVGKIRKKQGPLVSL